MTLMPTYLPGDVLRGRNQNLWKVAAVLGDIYTLHALTASTHVSATLMESELRETGVEKVIRMPEEIRAEATAAALAKLDHGEDPEAALSRLWDLAFLTGLSAHATN